MGSSSSVTPPPAPAAAHESAAQGAVAARRQAFRALHEQGCFVIPNPWDVGSARYLQYLGFPALATTSAGFAFSQGLPDSGGVQARRRNPNDGVGAGVSADFVSAYGLDPEDVARISDERSGAADPAVVTLDRNLAYIASIAGAVDLPVSADFMSGYGQQAEDVADSVARCVATGVAGLSIEDATGDPASPLYEVPAAIERIRAARQAIDRSGADVLLTARAECYHVSHPSPLRESVRRLQAYAEAGADVLFAPGPGEPDEIKELVEAVAPKPLNLLVVRDIGLTVGEIAALGVRRISIGGALALAAWTGFMRAARTLKAEGSFDGLTNLVSYAEINGLFAPDPRTRTGRK